jgi:hypothetical protein
MLADGLTCLPASSSHLQACESCSEVPLLVPVVFLMLPVVVLFALYPGLFTLSRIGR